MSPETQTVLSVATAIVGGLVTAVLALYRSGEKKSQQMLDLAKELVLSSRQLELAREKLRRGSALSSNPPPSS